MRLVFFVFCLLLICSCHRITREEQCVEMIKHEKRRLPRNVTKGLVLDSLVYDTKSQTIVYFHTLNDSIYSDEMLEFGKNKLQLQLREEIINSVSLKRLKEEGISFKYIYLGTTNGAKRLEMLFENHNL